MTDTADVSEERASSGEGIEYLSLHRYAEQAYLEYAISVVKPRALPQIQDGQKPVQRRILYAMHELKLNGNAKPRKSAAVVGKVLGELHPHGDTSVYDALVRVAQDFSMRYPLIEGQGNFGSRDGDGAAAMRYTEARLAPISELLLSELDQGTVDFVPNYDGEFQEPQLLPARLPFLLLNGARGPAVGYRPELPPHNLREVAAAAALMVRRPEVSLEEIMEVLPGPDFPGGGHLISPPSVIADTYRTGRGSLRMRAVWRREELARGQWRIVITELPHDVSTQSVMLEIEALTNPQPRAGKKDITQEQKNLKTLMLSLIESVRDDSGDGEAVRLVIEPKSSKVSHEELIQTLFIHTGLEKSVPVDLVMMGLDGNPRQKDLLTILREWVEFRFETVTRRVTHRLLEIARRLHILRGRMVAFHHIDEFIRVIREADDPRSSLIERFQITEIQADDILEIRLRQLARLEGVRIEREIAELSGEQESLQRLLDDRDALKECIAREIEEDSARFGDDRRTRIEEVAAARAAAPAVVDEPVTVILSRNGWIRSRQGTGVDRAAIAYKQGDGEFAVLETRTTHYVFILDNNGRVYSIRVADVPGGRGDGVPLSTLIDFQDGAAGKGRPVQAFSDALSSRYLFSNSGGYGFIAELGKLVARGKAGKGFMRLEDGEEVLAPSAIAGKDCVATVCDGSKGARLLMFEMGEVKELPGGRGVILMGLAAGERLRLASGVSRAGVTLRGADSEAVLTGEETAKFVIARARKGQLLPRTAPAVLLGVF